MAVSAFSGRLPKSLKSGRAFAGKPPHKDAKFGEGYRGAMRDYRRQKREQAITRQAAFRNGWVRTW